MVPIKSLNDHCSKARVLTQRGWMSSISDEVETSVDKKQQNMNRVFGFTVEITPDG
jgi:hypothetical protein